MMFIVRCLILVVLVLISSNIGTDAAFPTASPTFRPTASPTFRPTASPTFRPTVEPTGPTVEPTVVPTVQLSVEPTLNTNATPTGRPTRQPTTYSETTIYTIGGTGVTGNYDENVQATATNINYPSAIAIDSSSNIYFVDNKCRIRKIDTFSGMIRTIISKCDETVWFQQLDVDSSGNLYWTELNHTDNSYSSEVYKWTWFQGTSHLFSLKNVSGLAVDSNNYVYVADNYDRLIYKIDDTNGNSVTYVGTGNNGTLDWNGSQWLGDGGQATAADIGFCNFMHFDSSNNLYFADAMYNVVRKVTTEGVITSIAGGVGYSGYYGDGIPATTAPLFLPIDIAVDNSGNVYISDYSNNRVRKVDVLGDITTFAGDGSPASTGDGYSSTSASVLGPKGLEYDIYKNRLYFTEHSGFKIRMVINVDSNYSTPATLSLTSSSPALQGATFSPSLVHMITFNLYLTLDYWPYESVPDTANVALIDLFKDLIGHDDVQLNYNVTSSSASSIRDRKLLSSITLEVTANVTALTSKITTISTKFVNGINNNALLVSKLNAACGCTDYSNIVISFYGGEEYCIDASTPSAATCSYGNIKINPSLTSIADSAFYNQQITGVDFGGCYSLTTIGQSAFYQNEITGTLDMRSCRVLHTVDAYAFRQNQVRRVMIPQSVQAIKNGAFLSNPLELLYCEERVETMVRVISEQYEGAVIGCYGYSVDYFLFGYVYIKQYEFHVMGALIVFYAIATVATIVGAKSTFSLPFQVATLIASVDIMSNIMYFLFSYYLSRALFWVSFAFAICAPILAFIPAVLLRYRLTPHFLYDYYLGRIISRRYKWNVLWIWLSHERGAPLINNKRQAFTFSHHDSIPKIIVFIISWFILICLQLMSLSLFVVWTLLLSPYYLAVIAAGSFLHYTGLLAHGIIWNHWVWLFSGNNKLYSKSVTHDTRLLNEAICVQLSCVSIPLFVVKYLNMEVVKIYNEMDNYLTRWWCGYISVFISAFVILLGLYRYVYLTIRYRIHVQDVPFARAFGYKNRQSVVGLQSSSEDIRFNIHAEGHYKKRWQEKIIHSKLHRAMEDLMKLVSIVFVKDDAYSAMTEQLLYKRVIFVESILGALDTSINSSSKDKWDPQPLAQLAFDLITHDSIDLILYHTLREINVTQPADLLHINSHSVDRLLSVIRKNSTRELISCHLNLLSYFNPRRTSLIAFKQPNTQVIPQTLVEDIESNESDGNIARYNTVSVLDHATVHPLSDTPTDAIIPSSTPS